MTFLSRPAKGVQLVVGDRLETMFSHQPKVLQLRSNYPRSLGLMVDL
ncbi:myo-inosose-2 dehydratase [Pseudomonas sp. S37]|nr:myo-inosose-2 dehydratase [Pseudomonas sp. S37]